MVDAVVEAVRSRGTAPGDRERAACPVCGGALARELELTDRWLMRCACGARCTDRYSDGEPVAAYYDAVLPHHGKLGLHLDSAAALRAIARAQADAMEELAGPRRFGDLLEIGCGHGYLLAELEERGWAVTGLDISGSAVRRARERAQGSVHVGAPEDFRGGPFDRIAMFDVLAHLAEPLRTLRAIHALLRPGGDFVLSTVDEDWAMAPSFRALFRAAPALSRDLRDEMYEGQHYCYFGHRGIGDLLRRAGLELVRVRPLGTLSARYFLPEYGLPKRIALLALNRLDALTGSARKMTVHARRPK